MREAYAFLHRIELIVLLVCLHVQACKDETLLHMVDLIHDAIPNTPKAIFAKYSSPRYARASLVAKAGFEG